MADEDQNTTQSEAEEPQTGETIASQTEKKQEEAANVGGDTGGGTMPWGDTGGGG